jgi:signal transduction histidine kinase
MEDRSGGTRDVVQVPLRQEERSRRLIELLPALFFTLRSEGQIDYRSPQFHGASVPPSVFPALSEWTASIHPEDAEGVKADWRRCLEAGRPFEAESRLKQADGSYRWYLARIVPDRDETGRIFQWMGICTDIHQQKRAQRGLHSFKADLERRVLEQTRELEEALRELEAFSYTVAHDLRAPLRAIHGFAQILREDCKASLDATAQDYLTRITDASRKMDLLVSDLLFYGRLNRQDLPLQPVELEQVVEVVLKELSTELEAVRAELQVERPLPPVCGNSFALHLALHSLLSNAIRYRSPGAILRVGIRAEVRENRVRVWIEDNGIGIAPEHQERIFNVFERLYPSEQCSGTGIGLALVRRAMEKSGGQAGVESSPGRGSRFWIELAKGVRLKTDN